MSHFSGLIGHSHADGGVVVFLHFLGGRFSDHCFSFSLLRLDDGGGIVVDSLQSERVDLRFFVLDCLLHDCKGLVLLLLSHLFSGFLNVRAFPIGGSSLPFDDWSAHALIGNSFLGGGWGDIGGNLMTINIVEGELEVLSESGPFDIVWVCGEGLLHLEHALFECDVISFLHWCA